jgi:hypothetical protein
MALMSRRSFVQSSGLAAAGVLIGAAPASASMLPAALGPGSPQPREAGQRRPLVDRYSDLRRHFVFEYYPWYRTDPWEHWPEGGHHPPADFGSNYLPALGLYDSRSIAVM